MSLTSNRPPHMLRIGEVGGTIAQPKEPANLDSIDVAFGHDDDDPCNDESEADQIRGVFFHRSASLTWTRGEMEAVDRVGWNYVRTQTGREGGRPDAGLSRLTGAHKDFRIFRRAILKRRYANKVGLVWFIGSRKHLEIRVSPLRVAGYHWSNGRLVARSYYCPSG